MGFWWQTNFSLVFDRTDVCATFQNWHFRTPLSWWPSWGKLSSWSSSRSPSSWSSWSSSLFKSWGKLLVAVVISVIGPAAQLTQAWSNCHRHHHQHHHHRHHHYHHHHHARSRFSWNFFCIVCCNLHELSWWCFSNLEWLLGRVKMAHHNVRRSC